MGLGDNSLRSYVVISVIGVAILGGLGLYNFPNASGFLVIQWIPGEYGCDLSTVIRKD